MKPADSPFGATVRLTDVPLLGTGPVLQGGESRAVYELSTHPGWMAKIYISPLTLRRTKVLERLIALPQALDAAEAALVNERTAWPVARIVDDAGRTVGVVMPKAPEAFSTRLAVRGAGTREGLLTVDWLARPGPFLAAKQFAAPMRTVRRRVVRELLEIGALFARHGVVYGDWSYTNALWDRQTGAVFVIDVDPCGIGSRPWIQTPKWEDPLYPTQADELDEFSDRYRLAVATARYLAGHDGAPLAALDALPDPIRTGLLGSLLRDAFTTAERSKRPTAGELLSALTETAAPQPPRLRQPIIGKGGLTGYTTVSRRYGSQLTTPSASGSPPRPFSAPHAKLVIPPTVHQPVAAPPPPPILEPISDPPSRTRLTVGTLITVVGAAVLVMATHHLFGWL